MKRILLVMVCALSLLFVSAAFAADPAPVLREILDAKIVTVVDEDGQYVAGMRIEYPQEVAAGAVSLSTYDVNGFTNIAAYVNNDGVWNHAENAGKYVFVGFARPMLRSFSDGKVLQYFGGYNYLRNLALDVFQNADVAMADGSIVTGCTFKAEEYIHHEVDNYLALSYTNAAGQTVNYRLYVPAGYEAKSGSLPALPLAIFLHGGGETGPDGNNHTQVAANRSALNFTTPEAQAANPCFMLAPQAPADVRWGGYAIENVAAIVKELLGKYNIDSARIYGYGLSMGGNGTWTMMLAYPDLYAGTIIIANRGVGDRDTAALETVKDIPIWSISSYDDGDGESGPAQELAVEKFRAIGCAVSDFTGDKGFNGYLRGSAAERQAFEQVVDAKSLGANKLVTTYISGTVVHNPHHSWMATTDNATIRDWLFSQVNPTPYTPK